MEMRTYSNLWLGNRYKDYNMNELDEYSMVTILNNVRKIVNIVYSGGKYEITFATSNESYTDYKNKKIVIDASLINNPRSYSIYEIIDILSGLALHEAAHAEETNFEDFISIANENTIKKTIFNIVEDEIIENIVSLRYPGFKNYFMKLKEHYFKSKPKIKEEDSQKDKINNILNEFLFNVRSLKKPIMFYEEVGEAVKVFNNIVNNKTIWELKEIDRKELTNELYEILIKNLKQDEDNNNNGNINPNIDENDLNNNLKDYLETFKAKSNSTLSNVKQTKVEELISQDYSNDTIENPLDNREFKCHYRHMKKYSQQDKAKYNEIKSDVRKYSNYISENLSHVSTPYIEHYTYLNSGNIDEDLLYSCKFNHKIFNKEYKEDRLTSNYDINLLLDLSGSMGEDYSCQSNIRKARKLIVLLYEAFANISSINIKLFGYTDHYYYGKIKNIKRNMDEDKNLNSIELIELNKYSMMQLEGMGITPEYEALLTLKKRMVKNDNKQIIIVVTDGYPESNLYNMHKQTEYINNYINQCEKEDITTVHISLESDVNCSSYKYNIPYENMNQVSKDFTKLLNKLIK